MTCAPLVTSLSGTILSPDRLLSLPPQGRNDRTRRIVLRGSKLTGQCWIAMACVRSIGDELPGLASAGNNYRALAAASNGRLYAAPMNAARVLEINPTTGATRLIGNELPGRLKYGSLAAACNGRLYAAPAFASRILEIDPATGTTRLIGDELPGRFKYRSLAAASNGRLYAAPADASRVLEIDPVAGATRLIGDELRGREEADHRRREPRERGGVPFNELLLITINHG